MNQIAITIEILKLIIQNFPLICKSFIHFIYVLCTPFIKHEYDLSFTKESNGCWYIDIKNWPDLFHENLMMVAGADKLCDEFDDGTGHAKVHIITSNNDINNNINIIKCERVWAELKWGGQYFIPYNEKTKVTDM